MAKQHHIPTVSITANGDSPIAKKANIHIDMLCGEENVGPKIKGYSATKRTLHLLLFKNNLKIHGINLSLKNIIKVSKNYLKI
ncbi:MAG: hypothetical protein V8R63_02500 [Thomasclavelia ramosa]